MLIRQRRQFLARETSVPPEAKRRKVIQQFKFPLKACLHAKSIKKCLVVIFAISLGTFLYRYNSQYITSLNLDASDSLFLQTLMSSKHRTCVFTISALNNFGFVWSLYDSIMENSPGLDCFIWYIGDRYELLNSSNHDGIEKVENITSTLPNFEIVTMAQLEASLEGFDALQLGFKFDLVCLQTTIKPYAFKYTFKHFGADSAIYLDNDIWVTDSLNDVKRHLTVRSVVVTPHITTPIPIDGMKQTDKDILQAGVFNFGFVAFSNTPQSLSFLNWWAERLSLFGFVDLSKGMHFDQIWGMYIPVFFDHDDYFVIRDIRYNVAYLNLHETGPYLVMDKGLPHLIERNSDSGQKARVVFMHFSGISLLEKYDIHTISRHQTRYTLSDFPLLIEVFNEYMRVLDAHDALAFRSLPYGFDTFSDGQKIPHDMRLIYATAVYPVANSSIVKVSLDGTYDGAPPYGIPMNPYIRDDFLKNVVHDPFCADSTCKVPSGKNQFWEWALITLPTYAVNCDGAFFFSSLEMSVWQQRPDLQKAFVEPTGKDHHAFKNWFISFAKTENLIDEKKFDKWKFLWKYHEANHYKMHHKPAAGCKGVVGVNIIGWHTGVFSIGLLARKFFTSAVSSNIPAGAIHSNPVYHKHYISVKHLPYNLTRSCSHPVNFVVMNADCTHYFITDIPGVIRAQKYNIGYWLWELGKFPSEWMKYLQYFDEIWCASNFIKMSIESSAEYDGTPVKVLPIPYDKFTPEKHQHTSQATYLFSEFLTLETYERSFKFLLMFDCDSLIERKNPEAAIHAFREAFPSSDHEFKDYVLIVKMHSCTSEHVNRLHHVSGEDKRIILFNKVLLEEEMVLLWQHIDCYISLHRSEGYGMIILDSLANGIPVIATNYGGNTDFFKFASDFVGTCLFPVPYELIQIDNDFGPYKKGGQWANPDHNFTVSAMKAVGNNKCKGSLRETMSHQMDKHFGYESVGQIMKSLLIDSHTSIVTKLSQKTTGTED